VKAKKPALFIRLGGTFERSPVVSHPLKDSR
jgi:hypothetical protein